MSFDLYLYVSGRKQVSLKVKAKIRRVGENRRFRAKSGQKGPPVDRLRNYPEPAGRLDGGIELEK